MHTPPIKTTNPLSMDLSAETVADEQPNTLKGHTRETVSSNGAGFEDVPIYLSPEHQNGPSQDSTESRGYVSLPDFEPDPIPLHELPNKPWWPDQLPDHTHLPDSDDTFVKNFLEHRQSILLTTSIEPIIEQLHPDGRYKIGQDTGVYWRWYQGAVTRRGCEAPDWFYVPNVEGNLPRSYVMWQEIVPPLIAIEFVSGNGREERDKTPMSGKFWVYEHMIQPQYYAIYEEHLRRVEVYELIQGQYQPIAANARGHYPIATLDIELGIWYGDYKNYTTGWLRAWDSQGQLLLSSDERAKQEAQRAEIERSEREAAEERATQEAQRAALAEDENERLRAVLRQHGLLDS